MELQSLPSGEITGTEEEEEAEAKITIQSPRVSSSGYDAQSSSSHIGYEGQSSSSHIGSDDAIAPNTTNPNLNTNPKIPSSVFIPIIFLVLCILTTIIIYLLAESSFKGIKTSKTVDAIYFAIVTFCTIGYGDIVPDTTFTKAFTCFFILIAIGLIDFLLVELVGYICNKQESVLLSTADENLPDTQTQPSLTDKAIKVGFALVVILCCILIGAIGVHFLENLGWVDSFYLSVATVRTVGYGDFSFKTAKGRCFAIFLLLVVTYAVAIAFLFLTDRSIGRRNSKIAELVIQNRRSIRKYEFVINQLKEMGKLEENEFRQICNQFEEQDSYGRPVADDAIAA